MLYEIKPLKWKKVKHDYPDVLELYKSHTPICFFKIEKMITGTWYYDYCFDEYYDDGMGSCEGLEDGKIKCEKIWMKKLKKCLIKKE